MKSLNTRIRLVILALVVSALILLTVYAIARAAGSSRAGPVKRAALAAAPQPLVLTDEQGEYPLGLHLAILEDPGGKLNIDEVSSPAFNSRFTPSQVEVPNYGYTKTVYWLRLHLFNKASQTNQWLLETYFQNLNYVDLYIPSEGEGFTKKESGALRPFSTRDIPYYHVVFKLPLAHQADKTIYLRVKSGSSMTLAFILWSPEAFAVNKIFDMLGVGLFYGCLLMVLGYHVFLFFSLKEASYFYFVLFLASSILFFASYEGIADQFIWPGFSEEKFYTLVTTMSLFFMSALKFSDVFLEQKTRSPRLHRIYTFFFGFWVLMIGLLPFTSFGFMAQLTSVGLLLTSGFAAVSGFYSWRKGYPPARFYLISWLGFILGIMTAELVRNGTMPSTPVTEKSYQIGLVWLVLLWSLALADRINLLKAQTESANRSLRNSEQRLSQILEGLPLGVVLYGRDHRPKYANKRTSDILSNPVQDIQPDPAAGRTLPEAMELFSFQVAGTREKYPLENMPIYSALKGEPASADDIEMDQGDKRTPLEIWASPILDEEGKVESAVAAFQDITGRKQAEAELVDYRKHLEALVEKRTAEVNAANKELRLRLDWLSAINQVNQTMAGSADFGEIYEKITQVINHLFALQDSFIGELEAGRKQLKFLAHSCRSDNHPDLVGSFTTLPEEILSHLNLEQGEFAVVSRDQVRLMDGPIGIHIQVKQLQRIVLVPLQLHEQILGFLGLETHEEGKTITDEESFLLRIFSTDIAQLIEDAHLFEQAKKLVAAEERNRLARDLHDSVAQALYSISLFTNATLMALATNKLDVVKNHLGELDQLSKEALADMRLMIFELRPPILDKEGLVVALHSRLDSVEARAGFDTKLMVEGDLQLSSGEESELYRIAQEALNNVIKYAQANRVRVHLTGEAGWVRLVIEDDGAGFDPVAAEQGGGQGIRNMQERAKRIGGTCQIDSAPGQGTKIIIEVNK